jgi:hypothetical protein
MAISYIGLFSTYDSWVMKLSQHNIFKTCAFDVQNDSKFLIHHKNTHTPQITKETRLMQIVPYGTQKFFVVNVKFSMLTMSFFLCFHFFMI